MNTQRVNRKREGSDTYKQLHRINAAVEAGGASCNIPRRLALYFLQVWWNEAGSLLGVGVATVDESNLREQSKRQLAQECP